MARNEIAERRRCQALALLTGDKKLSIRKISEICRLERRYVLLFRRKYLLAKFLGADVKQIANNVLFSYITAPLPIETYFCFCVVQFLIQSGGVDQAKIFLFATGELCKRMNIDADEIEGLDENSIMNGIELINKQMKSHFY